MTNSTKFQTIVDAFNAEDIDAMRSFIRDTVRAEWGSLIDDLSIQSYDANMANALGDDPFLDKGPEPTEVQTRTYELELHAREGGRVTFKAIGLKLTVEQSEWESAGRPNRIKIVASVA